MKRVISAFLNSRRALILTLSFLLANQVCRASVTGSISGTVKDPTGAVIPGAAVVAKNDATGIQQTTQTNSEGFYSFPALAVGRYDLEVRKSGFQNFRQIGLVIDVNTALRVDVTLQVGTVTEAIEVTSTPVHVETTNTQMGEVIGGTKMTTIPLDGRSYTDLLALQPGVVPVTSGEYGAYSPSGGLNPGSMSVNGQRENANGFMVNGGTAQEEMQMAAAIIPNLDSISEFRILTADFDAEYGRYSGGQVNVATKSGTNQFHGDVFEFLRNTNLDARNFFSPSRAPFHRNQFGGTGGGPIKHDKLFFFGDYQGTRQVIGQDTGLIPVPSPLERTGNLSEVASSLTGSVSGPYWANVLSQELGYPVSVGEPYYTPGCPSPSQCVLPNAVIPTSAFSAPAQHLLQYIPTPNAAAGNFFTSSAFKGVLHDGKGSGRIDANTRLGMVSAYYFIDSYDVNNPYAVASVPGFNAASTGRAQMMNLGVTKAFGGSTVNEFRLQFMRDANAFNRPQGGVGPTLQSLGFVVGPGTSGIVPLNPSIEGVPSVGFNAFSIGVGAGFNSQFNNTFQALDNYTKVVGTHTIKLGADYHRAQINTIESLFNNGTFSFSGTETGLDFADYLLGAVSTYLQGVQEPLYNRGYYLGLYGQDSWRVRPNLTVNYGLRWDLTTPWWEKHNQQETIVVGKQSATFPTAPLGWVVPGDPGIPRTVSPIRYNNFAPRIGLAYAPRAEGGFWRKVLGSPGKTSIRAAYGIFYTAFEDVTNLNEIGDAPFGFFYVNPTPTLFTTPFIDLGSGHNEGQRFPVPLPPLNVSPANPDPNINWAQFEPLSSSPGFNHTNRVPYAENYTFSVQRQFGSATLLTLSYAGSQAHRLLSDFEVNPGNQALCLSISQPNEVGPGSGTCGPFGEDGLYTAANGQVIHGTRPLSPAIGSDGLFSTMGNSNYNSFQLSLRHSTGRLEFLAGYTYSKVLDNASGWGAGQDEINPLNPKLSKGLSSFDMTHNFVFSYSYRLPFDRLFSNNRLTSGWVVSGVTRFTTGLPVFINENDDRSLLGSGSTGPGGVVDAPDRVPGNLNFTDPRTANPATGQNPYFNISLFSREPLGHLGTSSQRFFHGPGNNNWDLALLKDLRLTESKTLQFRAEYFNVFNHTQFGSPVGNFIDSRFGFVTSANAPRIGQVAIKFLF